MHAVAAFHRRINLLHALAGQFILLAASYRITQYAATRLHHRVSIRAADRMRYQHARRHLAERV